MTIQPEKKKSEKCECMYDKTGKLRGVCLRCAKREINAFNRGRLWVFKKLIKDIHKSLQMYS